MNLLVILSFLASSNVFAQSIEVVPQAAPTNLQVVDDSAISQSQAVTTTVEQTPVVIQNQPQIQVQRQEEKLVTDTPLSESSADRLRRQRIDLEQKVESKIVEKLESDRILSEKERLNKILDNQAHQPQVTNSPIIAPVQVIAPQQQLGPAHIPVETAVVEITPTVVSNVSELDLDRSDDKTSVGIDFGFINYDVDNIQTTGAFGVSVAHRFDQRFIVEGSFGFSRSEIESVNRPILTSYDYFGFGYPVYPVAYEIFPTITEMDQYNFSGAFKYRLLSRRFSPVLGALLSYVYRDYEDTQYFDYKLTASSYAVDYGFLVGAEMELSSKFIIQAEYKYMWNAFYNVDLDNRLKPSQMFGSALSSPVEELGYSNFLVSLKYIF